VNGEQVSSGPQRSDLMHWRYETVDLAPQLHAGPNVLAALVWNWGAERPVAQFSRQTAFLLQGDSPREAVVNSGPEWKVLRSSVRSDSCPGRCRRGLLRVSAGRGDRRAPLSVGLDPTRLQGGRLGRGRRWRGRPRQAHPTPREQPFRRSGGLAARGAVDSADGGVAGTVRDRAAQ
jgi:hypothetical protein